MSRGTGAVERRIADRFAETLDRLLSLDGIRDHAFGPKDWTAARARALSATRAARRLSRRFIEVVDKLEAAFLSAGVEAEEKLGRKREVPWKAANAWYCR